MTIKMHYAILKDTQWDFHIWMAHANKIEWREVEGIKLAILPTSQVLDVLRGTQEQANMILSSFYNEVWSHT